MLFTFYQNCTRLMALWASYHAQQRARKGKEDSSRLAERRGFASQPRPKGPLVWIHAASVGETLSTLPLIEDLSNRYPALTLLVTTGTRSSATILERYLSPRLIHQYVPYDIPQWVQRFLDHWKPLAALWVESEFWPNLLTATQERRIPMVLINGAVSDLAFRRWSWAQSLLRPLLKNFHAAFAQSQQDAERLSALGMSNITAVGNLKFSASPLHYDPALFTSLQDAFKGRPIWVAASTHEGEEPLIAKAHAKVREALPQAVCILIPRHPQRRDSIIKDLNWGDEIAVRSLQTPITSQTTLYLADTLGELGLFYRLADIAFVGGSFVPIGGHNLIEPLLLECPCLHGPYMENFQEMAEFLDGLGASFAVESEQALAQKLILLFTDPAFRQDAAIKGKQAIHKQNTILERVLATLHTLLDPLCDSNVAHP